MKYHMWTKAELKKIVTLWDAKTLEAISEELNVKPTQVLYIVKKMKKAGIKIAQKHKVNKASALILELKKELNQ